MSYVLTPNDFPSTPTPLWFDRWSFDDRTDRRDAAAFLKSTPFKNPGTARGENLLVVALPGGGFRLGPGKIGSGSINAWNPERHNYDCHGLTFEGPISFDRVSATDCRFDGTVGQGVDARMLIFNGSSHGKLRRCEIASCWIGTPSDLFANQFSGRDGYYIRDCRLLHCRFFGDSCATGPTDRARQTIMRVMGQGALQFLGQTRWIGFDPSWVDVIHEYNTAQGSVNLVDSGASMTVLFGDQRVQVKGNQVGQLGRFIQIFTRGEFA